MSAPAQPKYLFFFGEKNENGFLSNFFEGTPFVIDKVTYKTSEHFFMATKALQWKTPKNEELFKLIINSSTPKEAKACGRKVENYDDKEWANIRFDVMVAGLRNKFSQNPKYKQELISTGDKILVEASPYDAIWGIGMTVDKAYKLSSQEWNDILEQRNHLGKALMKVRDELNH